MSRYIDADALKNRVSELIVPDWTRTLIRSWLDSEPTVDAVPVVRCRECKWLHIVNDNILYGFCTKGHAMFYPFQLDTREFYCADGERRTDGE